MSARSRGVSNESRAVHLSGIERSGRISWVLGGDGEIRTHGGVAPSAVFKTAALNHSATSPASADSNSIGDRIDDRSPALDLHHVAPPAVHPHRGELPAPHAACIERQQIRAVDEAERGPVAAGDLHARGGAV